MNFKKIKKYPNYQSYQRIKRIKYQQCNKGKSKCNVNGYQAYLDKKSGFVCCPNVVNCSYNITPPSKK